MAFLFLEFFQKNQLVAAVSSKKNGDRDLGMEVEETKDVDIRSVMHVVGPTLLRKRTKKDSKKQTQTKLKKKGAKSGIRKGFVAKRANSDSSQPGILQFMKQLPKGNSLGSPMVLLIPEKEHQSSSVLCQNLPKNCILKRGYSKQT